MTTFVTMSEPDYTSSSGIFFACAEKKQLILEQVIPEHILTHVYEGSITVTTADKTFTLQAGQTALFARNQLAKFSKEPHGELACRSATLFFTQPFLQQYYAALPPTRHSSNDPKVLPMARHTLLNDLFRSISTYSGLTGAFISDELALLKVKEAIAITRTLNKDTDLILSDFSEPHKIDLAGFMEKNFMFNIPISRFAYLTGRSLATFKRDFQRTMGTSPQKWLTLKRLGQAHFLIAEQQQKPSQAYVEAGFENFSHFTYAFTRHFGYNPSAIMSR